MQGSRGGGNIIINNGPTAAGGHILQGAGVGGMGVGFPGFPGSFGGLEGLQGLELQGIGGGFYIVLSLTTLREELR